MTLEYGGKSVYGASVGILMLETRFPRIHGDMANANTWPFPVQFRIVRGASPERVICQRAEGLEGAFIDAAKDLVAHGVDGLTTNCGYLSLFQDKIKDAAGVPVAASPLMQVPFVNSLLPTGKRAGVLTISKKDLSPEHLSAAGVPEATPVAGTEGGKEFARKIIRDSPEIDFAQCRVDLLQAADDLVEANSDLGAIILECTNMVPYAADIRKKTGLPVFSVHGFITWFQSALSPRTFPLRLDDPKIPVS
ncbi:MAG: aspartate/glutamate racemase family protein [Albidovulum sp.]|nr:aspartate/glutamate racemase family protein [Albidovulum sp.]MDE0307631.1 aspartate/glutamate racemase family protein [Albidovulum sp.]MDE0533071.1 aspartate/glutamate racemase family protein [Albidovulum sp.]